MNIKYNDVVKREISTLKVELQNFFEGFICVSLWRHAWRPCWIICMLWKMLNVSRLVPSGFGIIIFILTRNHQKQCICLERRSKCILYGAYIGLLGHCWFGMLSSFLMFPGLTREQSVLIRVLGPWWTRTCWMLLLRQTRMVVELPTLRISCSFSWTIMGTTTSATTPRITIRRSGLRI